MENSSKPPIYFFYLNEAVYNEVKGGTKNEELVHEASKAEKNRQNCEMGAVEILSHYIALILGPVGGCIDIIIYHL